MVPQLRDAGVRLISAHPRTAPGGTGTQVSVTPGGNRQLCAPGVASAGVPPGFEQPAALTAATSPAGGWAGEQALPRPDDREGQRGGASLVSLAMTDPRPPYASSGSFGDGGGNWCPRSHAGERPPHFQLPCRTAVWIASTPRGVSWRDTKPIGSQRGGASRAGPSHP